MKIINLTNQPDWDNWLKANSQHHTFTQSWAWGDVLLTEGKVVERLAVLEGEMVLAQAQVVYDPIPFGWKYAFCPQGPVFGQASAEAYQVLVDYLKSKGCIFFRVEPETAPEGSTLKLKKTIDINPPATLILDLAKSEDELLAGMHPKARYNIRLAEKKDLRISEEKNLETFWSLMTKTGSRDKFGLHHKEHYAQVLASPIVFQLTAFFGDKPTAVGVFAKFGDTFTYLYGASDHEYRNLMAPYLLQWEGIKMGRKFACHWYDFFGVAPQLQAESSYVIPTAKEESLSDKNGRGSLVAPKGLARDDNYAYDPKHQYAGVTRFKLGFGSVPLQRAGTFDLIIDSRKYQFYNFLRKLRRLF